VARSARFGWSPFQAHGDPLRHLAGSLRNCDSAVILTVMSFFETKSWTVMVPRTHRARNCAGDISKRAGDDLIGGEFGAIGAARAASAKLITRLDWSSGAGLASSNFTESEAYRRRIVSLER